MPSLHSLTNDQLKTILTSKGLSTQGNKAEMVTRLVDYLGGEEIDEVTYNSYFPLSNSNLLEQINQMKKMMESLAKVVEDMGQRMNQPHSQLQNQETTDHDPMIATPMEILNEQNDDILSLSRTRNSMSIAPPQNHFSVREIAETIPEYDPTKETSLSVEQFIQHIEGAKRAYNWNDKCLLLAVYSRLKGVARMWFDCRETLFTTWYEFKNGILDEFGSSLHEAEINSKMSKTIRRNDEQIIDYCFRIQALGKRFSLSESATIRYARDGLRNRELQNMIAATRFTTMRQFRETIIEYQANVGSYHFICSIDTGRYRVFIYIPITIQRYTHILAVICKAVTCTIRNFQYVDDSRKFTSFHGNNCSRSYY